MVMAKIHIICGNCGCNDMWEASIEKDWNDYGDYSTDGIIMKCNNCSTIHDLTGYMKDEAT